MGVVSKSNVIRDNQVIPAVVINVQKSGAGAPLRGLDGGISSNIGKRIITVILPHLVFSPVGDIEIEPTIVVKIAHRGSHAIPPSINAG